MELESPVLVFGDFALDPVTEELRRNGIPIPLQPQPLKVLAFLARRPGVLVTREELQRLLWGSNTQVDADRGLNFCIAQIRSALGDSAGSVGFVETLPRRGYRFRSPAPVERAPEEATRPADGQEARPSGPGEHAGPEAPAGRRVGRRVALVSIAIAACGVIGVALVVRARPPVVSAQAQAAALDALRHGRALRVQPGRDALKPTIASLEQAVILDPSLAAAHAELAEVYLESAGGDLWSREAMEKARALALRALRLDPTSSAAETTLGLVRLQRDWDWDDARRHLERGLALDPSRLVAQQAYALYLSSRGEPEAAVRLLQPTATPEAAASTRAELAWHLYFARRYPSAIALLRTVIAQDPKAIWPRMQLLTSHVLLGQDDEAFAETKALLGVLGAPPARVERVTRLPPRAAVAEFFRGRAEVQASDARSGAAIDPAEVAGLYELAGDRPQALTWLERAAAERSRWLIPMAVADPRFDRMADEPRYRALRTRLGARDWAVPTGQSPAQAVQDEGAAAAAAARSGRP